MDLLDNAQSGCVREREVKCVFCECVSVLCFAVLSANKIERRSDEFSN